MYCRTCGNEVPFGDNYCPFDGTFQQHDQQPHVTTEITPKFCSDCGTSNTGEHLYCIQCGTFQLTFIPFRYERVKEAADPTKTLPDLNRINKRMAILCAFLAFLMVGIASLLFAEGFQEQAVAFQETFEENTGLAPDDVVNSFYFDYSGESSVIPTDPFIGMTDYWMSAHLLNSKLSFDLQAGPETFTGGVHIQSGALILLLLPIAALLVTGYFYGRRNDLDTQQYWISSLLIGVIYGGLTAIIALFAGFSFDGSVKEELMTASLAIENSYPFFRALLVGFLIGTIFSFMGILFGSGTMKSLTSSPLKEGLRTILIGISTSIVITVFLLYRYITDTEVAWLTYETMPASVFIIIAVQGGLLLWNVLNLSPLTIEVNGIGENMQVIYSILSGLKIDSSDPLFTLAFSDPGNLKYLLVGLLIPITLFIWSGYRLQQQGPIQFHRMVLFGFIYAFLIGLLTAGTNTGFEFYGRDMIETMSFTDIPSLFIGFSFISTFFKCFIFSTLLAIAGAYWKKVRGQTRV
ncbi:zinc ribbon domain-containing protein [Pseudalkalibacillus hwajinpoensis]|uniref:zinc ribbon domain-containing protein n=1 Tax=Guptibacillus hwajinpoensis TaxID=208199 RepID=UPI00325B9F36